MYSLVHIHKWSTESDGNTFCSPTPCVTWTDSRGISLPLGRRQELTAYGTELMITHLTKGDEGTYTFLGNQEGGRESDPVQIILQVQGMCWRFGYYGYIKVVLVLHLNLDKHPM